MASKKIVINRSSVYLAGNQALPVGVSEIDEKQADALIARGLATEYAEPVVNKVAEKTPDTTKK